MIRELITPVDNTYLLNLPDEMIGKTIEVIAFEVDGDQQVAGALILPPNADNIKEKYSRYPSVSHQNYRFDRNEANDYE